MDERQKKIIQRCWEVLLFILSIVMVAVGLCMSLGVINGSSDAKTAGGIALTILGNLMLTPNTIIAMWIRQIMKKCEHAKTKEVVTSTVESVLEANGVIAPKNKKQSKKTPKNASNEVKQEPQNPFCTLE